MPDSKTKPLVNIPGHEILKRRISALKTRLKLGTSFHKVVNKYAQQEGPAMTDFDIALQKLAALDKQSFMPADQLGAAGQPPMDPAMMDPAMGGMPPGMPMDPSMMAPPMDPSMGGMPPMDPAMMAEMMGGGMPPAAPAPAAPAEGGAQPATMDDVAVIEERLTSLENLMKDMIDAMDQFGASVKAQPEGGQSQQAQGESVEPMGKPVMPGPFGTADKSVMGQMRAEPSNDNQLINILESLRNVTAG